MPGAVIGRFQPLHNSQVELIEDVQEDSNKLCIGVIGTELCYKNPLTYDERKEILGKVFPEAEIARFGNEHMKLDFLERHHQFLMNFPAYREDIREKFSEDVTIYTGDKPEAFVYKYLMGFDVEHVGRGEIDGGEVRDLCERAFVEGDESAYGRLEERIPEQSLETVEEVLPERYEEIDSMDKPDSSPFNNISSPLEILEGY